MYTFSDVVELGRAQDVIMGGKQPPMLEDIQPESYPPHDEFDQ